MPWEELSPWLPQNIGSQNGNELISVKIISLMLTFYWLPTDLWMLWINEGGGNGREENRRYPRRGREHEFRRHKFRCAFLSQLQYIHLLRLQENALLSKTRPDKNYVQHPLTSWTSSLYCKITIIHPLEAQKFCGPPTSFSFSGTTEKSGWP